MDHDNERENALLNIRYYLNNNILTVDDLDELAREHYAIEQSNDEITRGKHD